MDAVRVQTTVLPGHRIEVAVPDLPEGARVDVMVNVLDPTPVPQKKGILEFLEALPPGPRSYPTWEEIERRIQEERDAWDR